MLSKILHLIKSYQHTIFLGLSVLLISIISYNIGRINALEKTPLKITNGANIYQAAKGQGTSEQGVQTNTIKPKQTDLRVVVSKKSSTKKYHHLWCPGAKKIKEENKLWFNTAQEAQFAGYTLAGNCEL